MGRPGIRELVGRAMIEKEFLAELVRDPETVLIRFELDDDEKKAVMQAVGRCGSTSSPTERVQAFQSILMKRWST
jgi:hypothetical protein